MRLGYIIWFEKDSKKRENSQKFFLEKTMFISFITPCHAQLPVTFNGKEYATFVLTLCFLMKQEKNLTAFSAN